MPSAKNIKAVEELTDKLSRSSVSIGTDFAGVRVNTMTALRRHLRDHDIEYKVVKNTLVERSADAVAKPELKELLSGTTGLAFGYDDPIEPIKVITEYARTNRLRLAVRAAALEGRVFHGEEVARLAELPSREALIGQVVSMFAAPLTRLVNVLNNPMAGLAVVLQQRVKQLQGPEG